jgi:hypothetical protein
VYNENYFSNVTSYLSASQNVAADIRMRSGEQQAREEELRRDRLRDRERQERQESLTSTLQTVQLSLLKDICNKTTGKLCLVRIFLS